MVDGDLQLVLTEEYQGNPDIGHVPAYKFAMTRGGKQEIGYVELRIGHTDLIVRYAGHLGYRVDAAFRGHRYAARSCRLLLPLARRHGLDTLWITCDPDNSASRRTCELAGAVFVEIVDLPDHVDMFQSGERKKCRYRLDLHGDKWASQRRQHDQ
jgi:tagatose 1,6-diphosphate aldolase